jgi:hypothetical protein
MRVIYHSVLEEGCTWGVLGVYLGGIWGVCEIFESFRGVCYGGLL